MNRKGWVVAAAAAAVLAAAIAIPLTVDSGGGDHHSSGTLPPQDATAGQKLTALLQSGERVTHHASYSVTGDPTKVQGTQNLDVWRKGTLVREDSVRRVGTQTIHTISLQLATGGVLCVRADNKPWSCQKQHAPAAGSDPTSPTGLLTGLPNLSGQIVTTHQAVVAGGSVQCFDVTSLELCVTKDGVPASISSPDIRYELTALQTSVANNVFTPPATPR